MLQSSLLAFSFAIGASAIADNVRRATEPCARIASAIAKLDAPPYAVQATDALACLQSVPLDQEGDAAIIKALRAAYSFQSTLAYLKHPPPGALYPATDILGGIDDIEKDLLAGKYDNEYDFQLDLFELTQSAHDFHFNYNIDIVELFKWRRNARLISVSTDGLSLPDVYVSTDIAALNAQVGYTPSSISTINGIDVETWINDYAGLNPWGHDPDTNYNTVLLNIPLLSSEQGSSGGTFSLSSRYQGNDTVVTFANGTSKHILTYATTTKSFKGIYDGASLFEAYFTGQPSQETSPGTAQTSTILTATETAEPTLVSFVPIATQTTVRPVQTFFPQPLVVTSDFSVAGYLPADQPDLAVLQMPTFEPTDDNVQDFQNSVRELLATAYAQNRTKLILDIRGNGGGFVYLGYDTFRQLFPSIMPYGAAQIRSNPLYRDLVSILEQYYSTTPVDQRTGLASNLTDSTFDITDILDVNDKAFPSAQSFYGPYTTYGDNFTALERANLNRTSSTSPVDVYGFGNNTLPVPQVFKSENIVLLSDGYCGSTCAVFAEFMKSQANVKSIAVGGRRQDGSMQAVGGSKGAQVIDLINIGLAIDAAGMVANSTANTTLTNDLGDIIPGAELLINRMNQGKSLRVNFKNNIREGDNSLTPLQFVYEAADCRFFYTSAMITDQSLVWDMVYDIHWGNASCVAGSADQPSSLSGNLLSYLNNYPPVGANYTFGAPDSVFPSGIANLASTVTGTVAPTIAASTGATVFATATTYTGSVPASVATAMPTKTGSATRVESVQYGAFVLAVLFFM